MKPHTLAFLTAAILPTLALAAPQGRANRRPQQSQKALCLDIATAHNHMITYDAACKGNSQEEAEQAPEAVKARFLFHNNGCQNILSEADIHNATMAQINRLVGRNFSYARYCAVIKPTVDKAKAQFGDADGAK